MILEGYPAVVSVKLVHKLGCYGIGACGAGEGIIWQGYCGCWVFKCNLCGNMDWAKCCDEEDEEHYSDFEYSCEALTG